MPPAHRLTTPVRDFFLWLQKRGIPAGERSVEAWGSTSGFGRDSAIVLAGLLTKAGYLHHTGDGPQQRWEVKEGTEVPPETVFTSRERPEPIVAKPSTRTTVPFWDQPLCPLPSGKPAKLHRQRTNRHLDRIRTSLDAQVPQSIPAIATRTKVPLTSVRRAMAILVRTGAAKWQKKGAYVLASSEEPQRMAS